MEKFKEIPTFHNDSRFVCIYRDGPSYKVLYEGKEVFFQGTWDGISSEFLSIDAFPKVETKN